MAKKTCIGCRRLVLKEDLVPLPIVTAEGPKIFLLCSQCRTKLNQEPAKPKNSVRSALLGILLAGDLFDAGGS